MNTRKLFIGERFQIGTGNSAIDLEVVTFIKTGSRQIVTAKDADGVSHTVVIDLAPISPAPVLVGPVDIGVARALAIDVLGKHATRIPVTAEANILAAAVITLTGGAQPENAEGAR